MAFLLLIACANVAGLQFAHATSRTHEVSIRVAMGASPWRLLRQFLVENLLLAVAGALAGLFLADWCLNLMKAGMPPEVEKYLPEVFIFADQDGKGVVYGYFDVFGRPDSIDNFFS